MNFEPFFEKIAFNPSMLWIKPLMKAFKPAVQMTAPKAAMTAGQKAMAVAMPVGFMGLEGFGATKRVNEGFGGLGSAKSMPQTMNPWQNF